MREMAFNLCVRIAAKFLRLASWVEPRWKDGRDE
jgi:hypothetical protein